MRILDDNGAYRDIPDSNPTGSGPESEAKSEDKYVIAWRRTILSTKPDHQKQVKRDLLIVSKALRGALKEVLEDYPNISFDTEEVVIKPPFEVIYHRQKAIKKYAENASEQIRKDIDILLGAVNQEQATERHDTEILWAFGKVTFDLLWTLFYPGCLVVQKAFLSADQVYVVNPHIYSTANKSYRLGLWSIDHNGTDLVYVSKEVVINYFPGLKSVVDLEVYPFDLWKKLKGNVLLESVSKSKFNRPIGSEDLTNLIRRGRKFTDLCDLKVEKRFRRYKGPVIREGRVEMITERFTDGDDTASQLDAFLFQPRLPRPKMKSKMHEDLVCLESLERCSKLNKMRTNWLQIPTFRLVGFFNRIVEDFGTLTSNL